MRSPVIRKKVFFAVILLGVGFCDCIARAATIYVTTLQQGIGTGACSLQEAIYSSVLHDTLGGPGGSGIAIISTNPDTFVSTQCVRGDGIDTIVLPTGGYFVLDADMTSDAYNPYGPTATPMIYATSLTIEGNGATLIGPGLFRSLRAFAVGPAPAGGVPTPNGTATGTGSLTIRNLYIEGFSVKGGGGAAGGGGGMGAGGAIYLQSGTLTLQGDSFSSDQATGGPGGSYGGNGGGGGVGGNGGGGGGADAVVQGGGAGGSRGNGGKGYYNSGGGGGGTVTSGGDATTDLNGVGGYLCGADGGFNYNNGPSANCPGGGGGGGSGGDCLIDCYGSGGNGGYGGGGAGGYGGGGTGGFGGGGGAAGDGNGGSGGFGGGGGAGFGTNGDGGTFGGSGKADSNGGGGAGLGGAIFNDSGTLWIYNSTFYNNSTAGGNGGVTPGETSGEDGEDTGGAIFSRNGSTLIVNSTIANNQSSVSGGGVQIYSDGTATTFEIDDTILANNGTNECAWTGNVTHTGAGNLIMSNGSGTQPLGACDGVVTTTDPQLGALTLNAPGYTPTMAISLYSSAMSAADSATSLTVDQRDVTRPQVSGWDIGAYEICRRMVGPDLEIGPCLVLANPNQPQNEALTVQVSPAAGGTTNPAPATYQETQNSVIPLSAVPNVGYAFSSWTGNVAQPTLASTTITMDQPYTVTANFVAEAPPVIAKSFNPNLIPLNATTSLTFTIGNPTTNIAALGGVAFTDIIPTGLTVPSSASTVCGGTLTTSAPTAISLAGATVPVNGSCQFSVVVTGAAANAYTNTTGNVTSTNGGTGNATTANVTVFAPTTISKTFTPASIPVGGTSVLSFTISNPSTSIALTGISFTDVFPTGLQVASTPHATNTCGGTFSAAANSGTVGLMGGSLAANGSCGISVRVIGTTAGVESNTTGPLSSTQLGASSTSNTAALTVVGPPTISKAFGAPSIPFNGNVQLSLTITNLNTVSLSGIAFTDNLPSGLKVSSNPAVTNGCGGTVQASANAGSVSLSGGALPANNMCAISLNLSGTSAGVKNNTTGAISANESGKGSSSNTATVTVEAPPSGVSFSSPTVDFGTVTLWGGTSQVLTVTNTGATTVSFGDIYVSDLQNATAKDLTYDGGCGSSIASGKSCNVKLSLWPSKTGLVTALLNFKDNAAGSPQQVQVTANVIAPKAKLSSSSLNFGSQMVNSSTAGSVMLSNPGLGSLTITSINVVGTNAADFAESDNCGGSLLAGGSCTVSLTFTPAAKGTRSTTLKINDNAQSAPQTVSLSGKGT